MTPRRPGAIPEPVYAESAGSESLNSAGQMIAVPAEGELRYFNHVYPCMPIHVYLRRNALYMRTFVLMCVHVGAYMCMGRVHVCRGRVRVRVRELPRVV